MAILRLENPRKAYSWGSTHSLQELLGETPDGTPLAEVWMGAHPSSSSRTEDGHALAELSEAGRIGYLLKLLSADRGLSIQAHPSIEQAVAGYEDEERRGVPLDAPNRVYRDRNHKPELIVALEPFWAMSGFRTLSQSCDALGSLHLLHDTKVDSLSELLSAVLALPRERVAEVAGSEPIAAAPVPSKRPEGPIDDTLRLAWVGELYRQFGPDPGVFAPLFLNLIYLEPGEGLYQPSGVLHAYLRGTGVEVMANSDNVLRAGLTDKHVEPDALQRVVAFTDEPPALVTPRVVEPGDPGRQAEPGDSGPHLEPLCPARAPSCLQVYDTPAAEFRLYHLDLSGEECEVLSPGLPLIALCISGDVVVDEVELGGMPYTGAIDDRRRSPTGAGIRSGGTGAVHAPPATGSLSLSRGASALITSDVRSFRVRGGGRLFVAAPGRSSL